MSTTVATSPLAAFSAYHAEMLTPVSPLRTAITAAYRRDEKESVQWLLSQIKEDSQWVADTQKTARQLIEGIRDQRMKSSGVDALMHEFSLSSEEGIALMCLAEALLRIPDKETANRLISDKIGGGEWRKHLGSSPSFFVNAATWGLLITGKLMNHTNEKNLSVALTKMLAKGGEPLIRKGMDMAMRMLGNQFVTGKNMPEALEHAKTLESVGFRYSYDMLGEAAMTEEDAKRYYDDYEMAIHAIGKASNGRGIKAGPGISVKLSALHPRYSRAQHSRVMTELLATLKKLVLLAKQYDIGINIDAEEADRLELSLDLMEVLAHDPDLAGFEGLGFVVQGYQKRCPFVIDYLIDLARRANRKLMIRLVKGAYWDTEIKRSQVDGLDGYPLYTRKVYTDLSYLACAQRLLAATDVIYPQFATHNAYTFAAIWHWAKKNNVTDYEFQCLHGMGETLYNQIVPKDKFDKPCRIYAPVGEHETLLAYLVRRLLENGANSSFVSQIVDETIPVERLIQDPIAQTKQLGGVPHAQIPLPHALYGNVRENSRGLDLSNENTLHALDQQFAQWGAASWHAKPLLGVSAQPTEAIAVLNPADHSDTVGSVSETAVTDVDLALDVAISAMPGWKSTTVQARATILKNAADLYEAHMSEFMALAVREAGKSLPNAIAEVREAIDFLRYYAEQILDDAPQEALGPVVCISPWNFPLAIFTGEISAALAAGNTVLAKPAEQTPLIAYRAVQLLHEAGMPKEVLQFVPGQGDTVGSALTSDSRIQGVIFTGSTEVAQLINRTLAKRKDAGVVPLIAETGGQNAMIVDSSALPEQVIQDVIVSAFDSAGQRCSALRILCLQEDIADKMLAMLKGAMEELVVGVPDRLMTDIGPVIDKEAQQSLLAHIEKMRQRGYKVTQLALGTKHEEAGTFVPPTIIELDNLQALEKEVFGPVLHVLRYRNNELSALVDAINALGFGLTLGVHSRIDQTIQYVADHAHVGNIYINRNIVGAVVGVQPFGGEGKSGTGPKAGGPLYLKRLQKNASTSIKPTTMISNDVLTLLTDWANKNHQPTLVQLTHSYGKESLLGQQLVFNGPTGESNTMRFMARGKIACVSQDEGVLLNQIAAVIATGNIAIVEAAFAMTLPMSLPSSLLQYVRVKDVLSESDLHLALVDVSLLDAWCEKLAARSGALVPVIASTSDAQLPLWRLVSERALSVNTAAAGGNASLMTISA